MAKTGIRGTSKGNSSGPNTFEQNRVISVSVRGEEESTVGSLGRRIGMQMALSRGANGFRRGAGGVDEPARATDVFYAIFALSFAPSILRVPRGPVAAHSRP